MGRPKKDKNEEEIEMDDSHPFMQIERLMKTEAHKDTSFGFIHGDAVSDLSEDLIPTGSPRLDVHMGGGFKPGFSLFYGDFECGKTAQALKWGKNWQDKYGEKGLVIFFDAEGRLTKYKLAQSGIDTKRFALYRGNIGESIFDLIEKTIKNNEGGYRYFFILDSINAVLRKSEYTEKDLNDNAKLAGTAALTSMAFQRLSGPLRYFGHHLYLCSQIRSQNINSGKPEAPKPSGGKSTGFYGDIIGRMHKGWSDTFIKEGDKIIGNKLQISFKKTYNETTESSIDIPIKFKHVGGIWREYECLMIGMEWGWIVKSGSWFNFSEIFQKFAEADKVSAEILEILKGKVQGELNLVKLLENNQELVNYIESKYKTLAL